MVLFPSTFKRHHLTASGHASSPVTLRLGYRLHLHLSHNPLCSELHCLNKLFVKRNSAGTSTWKSLDHLAVGRRGRYAEPDLC